MAMQRWMARLKHHSPLEPQLHLHGDLSCPGAAGDELTVVLTNNAVNIVEAKGKLA